jgi:hypothetical protein
VLLPGEALVAGAPTARDYPDGTPVRKEWVSSKDTLMTRDEITAYLDTTGVLDPFLSLAGAARSLEAGQFRP